ncbi:hypothetical protein I6E29_06735 [Arcanobacterium haemolyticum]|nr:hypothetical protein [Arcanobacterium haemolyticum]
MSPLFKRNRDRKETQAPTVESPASAPVVETNSEQPAEQPPYVPMSRHDLIDASYTEWHRHLAEVAKEAALPFSAVDSSVIDLSAPHPTGAAQLRSGMPTLLSSLVREENALKVARLRLASLQHRILDLSERYGYAPVTLASGELTWTELPDSLEDGESGSEEAWVHASAKEAQATGAANFAVKVSDTVVTGGATQQEAHGTEGDSDDESTTNVVVPHDDSHTSSSTPNEEAPESAAGVNTRNDSAQQPEQSRPDVSESSPQPKPVRVMMEPALLRTVRLEPAGSDDAYVTLTAKCEINPTVLRALRNHGIPAEAIVELRTLVSDPTAEDQALHRIREYGRAYLPGFGYENRALVGSFVHPGQVLLSDLEAMKPYIETSGIMGALAGDDETAALTSAPLPPARLEDRAPEAERGVGDRDVAELATIEAVASGRSLVIDAPPGSQSVGTLAGIVADAVASGRSVLYVPGRASTGRALVDELDALGLSDLVLDFSELDNVAMRLRTGLRLRDDGVDTETILALRNELTQTRHELAEYIKDLHEVDPLWHESVYTLLQRLAELTSGPQTPRSQVRLEPDAVKDLAGHLDEARAYLLEAGELGVFAAGTPGAAWAGARIDSREEGDKAISRAARLASETIPVIMAQSQRVASETGLTRATTFAVWLEQINMLEGVSTTLDVFRPQIYERSAMDMVIATASREWRDKHGESMKGSERRRLTRQARDMLRPGASVQNLHDELAKVQRQRDVWRRYSVEGGWPKLPDGMSQIKATASEGIAEIRALEAVLPEGTRLAGMPLEDMLGFLRQLAQGSDAMETLPRRNAVTNQLTAMGLGGLIEDLRARGVPNEMVSAELDLVYASSVFEQLVSRSHALAEIGPAELTRLSHDLRRLDEEHTRTLAAPVRRAVVRLMRETISQRRDETLSLDSQLERYSTGALRDVIATYPRLVQVARPVWAIPSMMAAEFIPPMPWADVVVMDDMDALTSASAVSMLMRGRQIVVMGDLRKAGEDSAIREFAKILPVCELPATRAKYDELATQTLIEQGYGDTLTMVPAVPRADRTRLKVVEGRGIPSPTTGTVEGVQAEVDAVVEAVVNHTMTQPERSLAVVCVSEFHASRVREAIKKTVAKSAVLGSLTVTNVHEPFTVVDITSCTGLRRDSIILSVGYGKTMHGRVLHSFGKLSTQAGVTGLVEAVGAARQELTIISSLGPGEIGLDKVSAAGPRLLAKIIDRAGGESIQLDPKPLGGPVQPLISDFAARLRAAGWQVATDYGFEDGVRIPLVVGHQSLRGTWRVAVVFDDDDYAAEPSLRRRDRYWVQRLEERGWVVFQTFSTSLFIDLEGQSAAVSNILTQMREETLSAARTALGDVALLPDTGAGASAVGNVNGGAGVSHEAAPMSVARGPRPRITAGLPLAAYTDDQLDDMLAWIVSDRVPRTEDELLDALRDELDLHRRGVQIETVLRNVIRRSGFVSEDTGTSVSLTDTATQGMEALKDRLTGQMPVVRMADDGAPQDSPESSGESGTTGDTSR